MPRPLKQARFLTSLVILVSWFVFTGCRSTPVEVEFTPGANSYLIKSPEYQLVISGVADNSLEVLYIPAGTEVFPSYARANNRSLPLVIDEQEKTISIRQGELTAVYDKETRGIYYYRNQQLLTQQAPYSGNLPAFDFSLASDEKIMGGGQRILGMDRRGHSLPLYNRAHYGYETNSSQMNYSLPAVMSSQKYYLLFDNTAKGTLDLGNSNKDLLQFDSVGGRIAYIIGTEHSYPELIEEYTDVTGKPAMLPRWALGHFISRFGYHTEQEVREVAALTQDYQIPAEAIILDLYWFGPSIQGYMGNLDWDRADFPTPASMINDLNETGIKTILITEPFILTTSDRWNDAVKSGAIATNESGAPYKFDFYFGNTGLVDLFKDEGREWLSERYLDIFKQGVGGSWGDLGEPEVHPDDIQHFVSAINKNVRGDVVHNAYGHEWARLVYETHKQYDPEIRPFILMRSGFAGSQRFGMIPWTGDVSRSWGGMKPQVELALQMSLFGLGYNHSDIGGFAGTEGFEPELYLRWSQYGIFQPIFRPHAQEQIASEVVFQDADIRSIVTDYVSLRYQLMPYNYSLFYEHHKSGMPLMRPMFFTDENDASLIDVADQYMWGDAFLIKPVTDPGLSQLDVSLPGGTWFNYWTDEIHAGEQKITFEFDKTTMPVLVKAGSFIPMVAAHQNSRAYSSDQLILHYYHHSSVTSGKGQMYEDDGSSASAPSSGAFEQLVFDSQYGKGRLKLSLSRESGKYTGMPENRTITVQIHGVETKPASVLLDGNNLGEDKVVYNKDLKQLNITINWSHQPVTLEINNI